MSTAVFKSTYTLNFRDKVTQLKLLARCSSKCCLTIRLRLLILRKGLERPNKYVQVSILGYRIQRFRGGLFVI